MIAHHDKLGTHTYLSVPSSFNNNLSAEDYSQVIKDLEMTT